MPRRGGVWQARYMVEGLERDKERYQKHQCWEYSLCLWVSVQCSPLEKKLVWGEKYRFKVSCWHSLPEVKDRTKPESDFSLRVIFKVAPAHQINITGWHKGKAREARMSALFCAASRTRLVAGTVGAAALSPWEAVVPPLPALPARDSSACLAEGLAHWEPAGYEHHAARKGLGN